MPKEQRASSPGSGATVVTVVPLISSRSLIRLFENDPNVAKALSPPSIPGASPVLSSNPSRGSSTPESSQRSQPLSPTKEARLRSEFLAAASSGDNFNIGDFRLPYVWGDQDDMLELSNSGDATVTLLNEVVRKLSSSVLAAELPAEGSPGGV